VRDELLGRALAKHKVYRVNKNGFAGSGFTRKHVKSIRELHIEPFDQGYVFDVDRLQHTIPVSAWNGSA
jgi:hypothetical protein